MALLILLAISCMLVVAEGTIEFCVPLGSPNSYDNVSSQLLEEKVITEIKTKLALTPDPIYFDHLDLNVVHEAIRFNGTMDTLTLYGITDITFCLFAYDETALNLEIFNLTFNNIDIRGLYNIDGNIGDLFDIWGNGSFWLDVAQFSIAMANFNASMGDEMCVSFDINVHIQDVKNYFHNFMDDVELEILLNHVLQGILPEAIEIVWEEFKNPPNIALNQLINDFFHNANFMELLNRIVKMSERGVRFPGICFDI